MLLWNFTLTSLIGRLSNYPVFHNSHSSRYTMTTILRRGIDASKVELKRKSKKSGWVLEKQTTSFADPDKWSNIDSDVTPLDRRTWSSWTVLGFWISDAMNSQGWQAPSAIIAVGLTWREAICMYDLSYTV